jgi:hypothetical protein
MLLPVRYWDVSDEALAPLRDPATWRQDDPSHIEVKIIRMVPPKEVYALVAGYNGMYLEAIPEQYRDMVAWAYMEQQRANSQLGLAECSIRVRQNRCTTTYKYPDKLLSKHPNSLVLKTLDEYDLWVPGLQIRRPLTGHWKAMRDLADHL